MSTFQAIWYGIIHGFAEFLPISAPAHHQFMSLILEWPYPTGALAGALSLGALLALLIYFRHDWASVISSFIQVIIFRKRPMTLDERMPFFLFIATLPSVAAWYYLQDLIAPFFVDPLWTVASLVGFGILLWFAENNSRKTKGMFDWNWFDSLILGLTQALMFIPGCGRTSGALIGAFMRNYNREVAAKFAYFMAAPILAANTFRHLRGVDFHAASAMPDLSWFTFAISAVVTLFASLLAIGGFMKTMQRKGVRGYVVYRFALAAIVGAVFWMKANHWL